MWKALLAAIAATGLCAALGMHDLATGGLVFTAFFALFVNVDMGARILGGDPLFLGGKIAHIGLAIFFLGVVATGKYSTKEHVVMPRGTSVQALGHTLTYTGFNVTKDQKYIFDVRADQGATSFVLHPVMFQSGEQGIMRNPDIVSHLTQDFYISPQSLEPPEEGNPTVEVDFEKGQERQIGDATVTFTGFEMGGHKSGSMSQEEAEQGVAAVLLIRQGVRQEIVKPRLVPAGGTPVHTGIPSSILGGDVQLLAMNISMGEGASKVTIGIVHAGQQAQKPDILVAEASIKPFINLIWAGTVLMMIGFGLAIVKRWRE
jgi:cytochrome c-type biogenesis protein CcmF